MVVKKLHIEKWKVPQGRWPRVQLKKGSMWYRNCYWMAGLWGGLTNGLCIGNLAAIIIDPYFTSHMPMSESTTSFMVAMMQVGALVGALALAPLADSLGRRAAMCISMLLFIVGSLLAASIAKVEILFTGRFISGLGMGLSCQTFPIYLSELAPASIRGTLDALFQLFLNVGIMLAYVANSFLLPPQLWWGWRASLALPAVPAVIFACLSFCLPESPRWHLLKGRVPEAIDVLRLLRDAAEVESEVEAVLAALHQPSPNAGLMTPTTITTNQSNCPGIWSESWLCTRGVRAGVGVLVLQVLSGVDVFTAYTPRLLELAGGDSREVARGALYVAAAFPLCTLLGVLCAERFPRRELLTAGAVGMGLSLAGLAALFFFSTSSSVVEAEVTFINPPEFSETPRSGGLYIGLGSAGLQAVLFTIVAYIFCFSLSWGPLPWCVAPELFPLRVRSQAMSVGIFANWVADWFVVAGFLPLAGLIGAGGALGCLVPVCVFAVGFVVAYVPETRGLSLEEVQARLSARNNTTFAAGTENETGSLRNNETVPVHVRFVNVAGENYQALS